MSISSMADESALRLTSSTRFEPLLERVAGAAANRAALAASGNASVPEATREGLEAAQAEQDSTSGSAVTSSPLSVLVKYIPTETITIYVALLAALGELKAPAGKSIADADFTGRWITVAAMLVATVLLTLGLSYRSQKNEHPDGTFSVPVFEISAAGVAFVIWALALPSTPLRDFAGYDYSAWNSVLILIGTVAVSTTAYVLGKTVSWQKVPA